MKEKDPYNRDWDQEPYYVGALKRAEERERYLEFLFRLPGKSLEEPPYLIDQLLPEGYLAVLAGDPNVGKPRNAQT